MTKDERIALLEGRVAELETLLGTSPEMSLGYRALGMTPIQGQMIGMLMRRQEVTREQMTTVIYGNRPEDDIPEGVHQILNVQMVYVRRKLESIDVRADSVWGRGWMLMPDQKQKLKGWLAQFLDRVEHGEPKAVAMLVRRPIQKEEAGNITTHH